MQRLVAARGLVRTANCIHPVGKMATMTSLFFVRDVGDSDETVSVWKWLWIHRVVAARLLRVPEHGFHGYMADNLWTMDETDVVKTPFD